MGMPPANLCCYLAISTVPYCNYVCVHRMSYLYFACIISQVAQLIFTSDLASMIRLDMCRVSSFYSFVMFLDLAVLHLVCCVVNAFINLYFANIASYL